LGAWLVCQVIYLFSAAIVKDGLRLILEDHVGMGWGSCMLTNYYIVTAVQCGQGLEVHLY
jgi:hypothetical protein